VTVGDLLHSGAVGMHRPDMKGAAGVGLNGDEVTLGGEVGVGGFDYDTEFGRCFVGVFLGRLVRE